MQREKACMPWPWSSPLISLACRAHWVCRHFISCSHVQEVEHQNIRLLGSQGLHGFDPCALIQHLALLIHFKECGHVYFLWLKFGSKADDDDSSMWTWKCLICPMICAGRAEVKREWINSLCVFKHTDHLRVKACSTVLLRIFRSLFSPQHLLRNLTWHFGSNNHLWIYSVFISQLCMMTLRCHNAGKTKRSDSL